MNKTYIIIALIVGVVVGIAGLLFLKPVLQPVSQQLGALAGPDIPYSYLRWGAGNGVSIRPSNVPFTTASTTVCSTQSPAGYSILTGVDLNFTVSSTSAATVTIATSTTVSATTTLLYKYSTLAGTPQQFSFMGTTTDKRVIAPNTYINVSMTGGDGGTFSPTGSCSVTFREI